MSFSEETIKQDLIVDDALQLFHDQPRIFQYTSVTSQDYQPVIKNSHSGQIVWEITPSQFQYTKPEFILNVSFKVTKEDGSDKPANEEDVAVVDLPLYSLFKTCRMKINEHWCVNVQDYYPMLQYVTHRLTYPESANKTWCRAMQGVCHDTPGSTDMATAANHGWTYRAELVGGSRIVSLKGRLQAPMMQCGKAFLPGTKFTIVLEHR